MPPDQLNVGGGQFGTAIGGADALRAALERRGVSGSVLDAMSPAAGGTEMPPNLPQDAGGFASPEPQMGIDEQAVGQAAQTPQARSFEMQVSLSALKGVVDSERKIAEALSGLR